MFNRAAVLQTLLLHYFEHSTRAHHSTSPVPWCDRVTGLEVEAVVQALAAREIELNGDVQARRLRLAKKEREQLKLESAIRAYEDQHLNLRRRLHGHLEEVIGVEETLRTTQTQIQREQDMLTTLRPSIGDPPLSFCRFSKFFDIFILYFFLVA